MRMREIQTFSDRVVSELESINNDTARLALVYVNTSTGLAQLHDAVQSAAPTEDIADQMCELATMWRDADPIAYARVARFQAEVQDEAAEHAETIEAERKAAREAVCVPDAELADEMTDLTVDELLTLWGLTCDALGKLPEEELCLDHAGDKFKELLSARRRLEFRIDFLQNHKET